MNEMVVDFDYGVVIPTRGRRGFLAEALESVYAQTVPPSQVVVVVDEDIDGTISFLRSNYPSVQVIEHAEPLGPAASRNAGIELVTAEWVALLDDDDIWHSNKQERAAIYVAEHPDCEALRSHCWQFASPDGRSQLNANRTEIFTEGGRVHLEILAATSRALNSSHYLDIQGRSLELLLHNNRGVTSSSVFKRRIFDEIPRVPDDLRTAQDWLLFTYIATRAEWHLLPDRCIFYRVHSHQITNSPEPSRWRYRVRAWQLAWANAGHPKGFHLKDYAVGYSAEARGWFWGELGSGRLSEAAALYRGVSPFINSRAYRWSILVPPSIVHGVTLLAEFFRLRHRVKL